MDEFWSPGGGEMPMFMPVPMGWWGRQGSTPPELRAHARELRKLAAKIAIDAMHVRAYAGLRPGWWDGRHAPPDVVAAADELARHVDADMDYRIRQATEWQELRRLPFAWRTRQDEAKAWAERRRDVAKAILRAAKTAEGDH